MMKPTGSEEKPCPSCGRAVIFDHDELTTHHEAPVCAWFENAVKESGGESAGVTIIVTPDKN